MSGKNKVQENNIDESRRKLAGTAIATPVILALSSRPAWGAAGTCTLSGMLSGNISDGIPTCDYMGLSAAYWADNTGQWAVYSAGDKFDSVFGCTVFGSGVTLLSVVSGAASANGVTSCASVAEVNQTALEAVAGILNAGQPYFNFQVLIGNASQVISLFQEAYGAATDIGGADCDVGKLNTLYGDLSDANNRNLYP